MTTSLLSGLLSKNATIDERGHLAQKIAKFGALIENRVEPRKEGEETDIEKYLSLSSKQTTDAKKRKQRQELFEKILGTL